MKERMEKITTPTEILNLLYFGNASSRVPTEIIFFPIIISNIGLILFRYFFLSITNK